MILLHESVHIKNLDSFWNFMFLILIRLNWFNPMAYSFLTVSKNLTELATDEFVIKKYDINPYEYLKSLLASLHQTQDFLNRNNKTQSKPFSFEQVNLSKYSKTSHFTFYASHEFQNLKQRFEALTKKENFYKSHRAYFIILTVISTYICLLYVMPHSHAEPLRPQELIRICDSLELNKFQQSNQLLKYLKINYGDTKISPLNKE